MARHHTTTAWRAFRLTILARDLWTCQMCGVLLKEGKRDLRSAVVDHIKPVALRPDLLLVESNCRATCRRCHAICDSIEKRHADDESAIQRAKLAYRPVGLDGYPT